MRLFIDTANINEIRTAAEWGILAGVTTNPSLLAREGWSNPETAIADISRVTDGAISIEVVSSETRAMVEESRRYAAVSSQAVIKIPMTPSGLAAAKQLSNEGIKTNITLVFSVAQGLLAAETGANYISVFVGRWDDISSDGMDPVYDLAGIFSQHGIEAKIIAASIRNPLHVIKAAEAGAHFATVPFKVLEQMFNHPRTEAGIAKFQADWENVKERMMTTPIQ